MSVSASAFVLTIENVDFFIDNDFVDNDPVNLIDTAAVIDTTLVYSDFCFTGESNSKLTISKIKKLYFFLIRSKVLAVINVCRLLIFLL